MQFLEIIDPKEHCLWCSINQNIDCTMVDVLLIDQLEQTKKHWSRLTILDTQSTAFFIVVQLKTIIDERLKFHCFRQPVDHQTQQDEDFQCGEWKYQIIEHLFVILFRVIVKATMSFECEIVSIKSFIQTHELEHSQRVEIYKTKAPDQRCFLFYVNQYLDFVFPK